MRGTLMAIRTPVSTSLNDFKQREAACLHVPLFFSLGKPNTLNMNIKRKKRKQKQLIILIYRYL